jgi:hypothetical protein
MSIKVPGSSLNIAYPKTFQASEFGDIDSGSSHCTLHDVEDSGDTTGVESHNNPSHPSKLTGSE